MEGPAQYPLLWVRFNSQDDFCLGCRAVKFGGSLPTFQTYFAFSIMGAMKRRKLLPDYKAENIHFHTRRREIPKSRQPYFSPADVTTQP